jgi:hypothetical protein
MLVHSVFVFYYFVHNRLGRNCNDWTKAAARLKLVTVRPLPGSSLEIARAKILYLAMIALAGIPAQHYQTIFALHFEASSIIYFDLLVF